MDTNLNGALMQAGAHTIEQTSAGAILSQYAAKKDEKVLSLSSLSAKQKDKIRKVAMNCLEVAKQYYNDTVQPAVKKRTDLYNADNEYYKKKFPRLSEKTTWKSRDIQTAAEWLLPGLVEAFTGASKPVNIKGQNVDDDIKAKNIENILSYQLERKNSLYNIMFYSIDEALRSNFGVVKVWWKHEEERERYELLMPDSDSEFALVLAEGAAKGDIEIIKSKPLDEAPDLIEVVYDEIKVTANYPVLEYLQPYEVRFTPEGSTFQNTKFVAHRKVVTGDYLKRKEKEGIYKNVDEAIKNGGDTKPVLLEEGSRRDLVQSRSKLDDHDDASRYIELIEAYLDVDYNNDGITEHVIVHMVGDVLLRVAENEFGFVPFYPCCAYYSPDKIFSEKSFEDIIEQQQDLKTALVKQMIINIGQQNAGQRIVDVEHIDINGLIDGDEIVLTTGDTQGNVSNYVYAVPTPQLSPQTMQLIEYAQNEIEAQTGSTRYNQGLDSNSLNKTATGITAIMGAADKRAKMIAKNIAEKFYKPIIKAIILMDQMFMRDEEIIRVNDENVAIRREDLDIDYDIDVNVGEGAGTKEARIQYSMILLNSIIPMLVQNGIANENTVYATTKSLLEEMGMKSTLAFMVDPQSPEGQQMKQQQQAQAEQQQQLLMQQQQEQRQFDLLKALAPNISVKYENLPLGAQTQLLNFLGFTIDSQEVISKALLDDAKERGNNEAKAAQAISNLQSGTGDNNPQGNS